ncbi:SKIP/SNW domain protein, partial [Ancylostoma ceylanicum]
VRRDPWFRGREDALPSTAIVVKEPPPYGKRQGFKPRTPEDYGDGGAFPEIHFAQFPLGMGMGERKGKSEGQIALQYDADGKLRHDAIARIGHDKNKVYLVVYTKLADMRAKVWDEEDEDIQRPDEETIAEQTEKTRLALEKITESKVASALPVRHAEKQAPAQYIRYTPSQQSSLHAGGSQQRIIRMVEEQKDPMEPPKFRINQKIPRAPPSPPAPVMHSPPRKVTTKDQNDWKIPPCISNWKNPKGFTVSLDKRLAADGRGLQQERAGIRKRDEDDDEAVRAREEIRRDRLDDIRKERNIARNRPDKVDKLMRDRDRDISEKIVLGLPDAKVRSSETQFDQRLFDQNKGLDSGAMDDETYNPYDKAWRGGDNVQQHIYRPSEFNFALGRGIFISLFVFIGKTFLLILLHVLLSW